MQETWVLSLGKEDLLEKGLAAHSSILAWRIQWTEEPGGAKQFVKPGLAYLCQSLIRSGLPKWLSGKEYACQCRRCRRWVRSLGREDPLEEENSNPLQNSCLENPMDREA